MARKKILFVIVEGRSDEEALGVILNRIYDYNAVYIHIMHRDITAERGISPDNIVSALGNELRKYAKDNHFLKTDFSEIIHIVDMDGAYIPNQNVIQDDTAYKTIYSTADIRTNKKSKIEARNVQKSSNVDRLCKCTKIWDIKYRVFYMSCNLDHVLYNKLNSNDEEKEEDSYQFAKRYRDDIPAFLSFISESDFSVCTSYDESWEYIKQQLHSLERYTNLGLCFLNDIKIKN